MFGGLRRIFGYLPQGCFKARIVFGGEVIIRLIAL